MDRTFKRERSARAKKRAGRTVADRPYEDLQIKGIREELQRVRYNERFIRALCTVLGAFLVTAAIFVLITNLWLPIFRMKDNQMKPLIAQGQILAATKSEEYHAGDIIAFHNNQQILVRRVIACEGAWVNISADGTVYVNDTAIEEGYLSEKALGDCSISLPCHVPKGSYFVMSDQRTEALDSRDSSVGCISEGQIVGRVRFGIWPPKKLLCSFPMSFPCIVSDPRG